MGTPGKSKIKPYTPKSRMYVHSTYLIFDAFHNPDLLTYKGWSTKNQSFEKCELSFYSSTQIVLKETLILLGF